MENDNYKAEAAPVEAKMEAAPEVKAEVPEAAPVEAKVEAPVEAAPESFIQKVEDELIAIKNEIITALKNTL